jgi:predicted dehydrogenase
MNNFTGHYPIDDNSVSVVEFKNNAIGLVDCSWVHRSGPNLTEIYGTEGSIVIGQGDLQFQTRKLSEEQQAEDLANMPNSLPSSMQQWINAILYDETMSITIQDGRDLTELMQGFYMANEQGKSIDFPL